MAWSRILLKPAESVRVARKAKQDHLRAQLCGPDLAPLLERCEAIYQELLPRSGLYTHLNAVVS